MRGHAGPTAGYCLMRRRSPPALPMIPGEQSPWSGFPPLFPEQTLAAARRAARIVVNSGALDYAVALERFQIAVVSLSHLVPRHQRLPVLLFTSSSESPQFLCVRLRFWSLAISFVPVLHCFPPREQLCNRYCSNKHGVSRGRKNNRKKNVCARRNYLQSRAPESRV